MQTWFSLIVCGVVIGIANIIPGVSGGTMAVVLNIYDKLIISVSELRKNPKKALLFLIPIGIGGCIGIVVFSFIIKYLLNNYPTPLNSFFIGLIIGSIPLIVSKTGKINEKKLAKSISFIIAFVLMIIIGLVTKEETAVAGNVNLIKISVDTFISAIAMILPGISGSLVMVILGSYFTVIKAISEFNIIVLLPVAISALIGIFVGSKVIAYCIERYEEITFSAITGLIVGSIFTLIKVIKLDNLTIILISLLCFAFGTLISYLFGKNAK